MPGQVNESGSPSYGTTTSTRPGLSDLRSDAAAVTADVKHLARDSATVAKDTVMHSAKDIAHRAETAHEQMCGYVKKNPTTSILIALGAGAIIGRIFSR